MAGSIYWAHGMGKCVLMILPLNFFKVIMQYMYFIIFHIDFKCLTDFKYCPYVNMDRSCG